MRIENRNDYIYYRLNRAKKAFEEALILAGNNKWNAVVNRFITHVFMQLFHFC